MKRCVGESKQSENTEEIKQEHSQKKPHLHSSPAEDGQGDDDGGNADVGDGDDHDWKNLEIIWYVLTLDDCVRGDVVEGAGCVGGVGGENSASLACPEVDVQVPTDTLLKISS